MAKHAFCYATGIGAPYHPTLANELNGVKKGEEWYLFEKLEQIPGRDDQFIGSQDGSDVQQAKVTGNNKKNTADEIRKLFKKAFTGKNYGDTDALDYCGDRPEVVIFDGTAWFGTMFGVLQSEVKKQEAVRLFNANVQSGQLDILEPVESSKHSRQQKVVFPRWGSFFLDSFVNFVMSIFGKEEGSTHTVMVAFDTENVDEAKFVTQINRKRKTELYEPRSMDDPLDFVDQNTYDQQGAGDESSSYDDNKKPASAKPPRKKTWIMVETKQSREQLIQLKTTESIISSGTLSLDEKLKLSKEIDQLRKQKSIEELVFGDEMINNMDECLDVMGSRRILASYLIKYIMYNLADNTKGLLTRMPYKGRLIVTGHGFGRDELFLLFKDMNNMPAPTILNYLDPRKYDDGNSFGPTQKQEQDLSERGYHKPDVLAFSTPVCFYKNIEKIRPLFYDQKTTKALMPSVKWLQLYTDCDVTDEEQVEQYRRYVQNCMRNDYIKTDTFVAMITEQKQKESLPGSEKVVAIHERNKVKVCLLPLWANFVGEADSSTLFLNRMAYKYDLCKRSEVLNNDSDMVFLSLFYLWRYFHLRGHKLPKLYLNFKRPGNIKNDPDICDVAALIEEIELWDAKLPGRDLSNYPNELIDFPVRKDPVKERQLEDIARGKSVDRFMQVQTSTKSAMSTDRTLKQSEASFNANLRGGQVISQSRGSGGGRAGRGGRGGRGSGDKGGAGPFGRSSGGGGGGSSSNRGSGGGSSRGGRGRGRGARGLLDSSVVSTSISSIASMSQSKNEPLHKKSGTMSDRKQIAIPVAAHTGFTELNYESECIDRRWEAIDETYRFSVEEIYDDEGDERFEKKNDKESMYFSNDEVEIISDESSNESSASSSSSSIENKMAKAIESIKLDTNKLPVWVHFIFFALFAGNDFGRGLPGSRFVKFLAAYEKFPVIRKILNTVKYDNKESGDHLVPSTMLTLNMEKALGAVYYIYAVANIYAFPDHCEMSNYLSRDAYISLLGLADICEKIEKHAFKGGADQADLDMLRSAVNRSINETQGKKLPSLCGDFHTVPHSLSSVRNCAKKVPPPAEQLRPQILNHCRVLHAWSQAGRRFVADRNPMNEGFCWLRLEDGSSMFAYDFGFNDFFGLSVEEPKTTTM